MSLSIGDKLGPYEITALLGKGGMGEVYKAHDTRLHRDVAIKLSNAEFSERFTREARAIAALNHTNVCHLYDVVVSKDAPNYLVMEYVEGSDLRGPMDFDDALPLIQQLIDGIEAAYEKGITHRDLKPANIKVTPEGVVKILDFGLARLDATSSSSSGSLGPENSPTMSMAATAAGTILGTAAYMAPEQAKGKTADRRADIWAFGVIVYELLTGKRLFTGESPVEILGGVLNKEPDLTAAPVQVHRLLRWCLEKDRKNRLAHIGDARRLLIEGAQDQSLDREGVGIPIASLPAPSSRLSSVLAGAAVLFAITTATLAFLHFRTPQSATQSFHLTAPSDEETFPGWAALSPDGKTLLTIELGTGIHLRSLESNEERVLPDTVGSRVPFWSPDSKSIGYYQTPQGRERVKSSQLRVVSASGGPYTPLCDVDVPAQGTWNRDGVILFSTNRALTRVSSSGGPCTQIVGSSSEQGFEYLYPVFLPDGEHYLYVQIHAGDVLNSGLFVASIRDPKGKRLLPDISSGVFAPVPGQRTIGHLVFLREGNLMVQSFDTNSLELSGEPRVLSTGGGVTNEAIQVAAFPSDTGILAYFSNRSPQRALIWYDRAGKELSRTSATGGVSISPDGSHFTGRRIDQNSNMLVLFDINRHTEADLLIASRATAWSPDSKNIAYSRGGALQVKNVETGNERVLLKGQWMQPSHWSRDGRFLFYAEGNASSGYHTWLITDPLNESNQIKPIAVLNDPSSDTHAQLSPNGKWLAYRSGNVYGAGGIYIQRFRLLPNGQVSLGVAKWQASDSRGTSPLWRADGKELYYQEVGGSISQKIMAVPVRESGDDLDLGKPSELFSYYGLAYAMPPNENLYSPSSDGQKFLVSAYGTRPRPSIDILVNWQQKLAGK